MEGKCTKYPECPAPTHCHLGKDVNACEFWSAVKPLEKQQAKKEKTATQTLSNIPWSGDPFLISDISQVSFRSTPIILGIAGKADAGKTTFLAMLYTLLLNGKSLDDYCFAGSKTIIGWDQLYHKLLIEKNDVAFPDPTDTKYHRLFHLALKTRSDHKLKDILLSDASGEAFTWWARKREDPNAESARWIYENSNGFILFVDCMDLVTNKNSAKTKVIDIAQMLKYNLKNRPVVVVWSKSDKKKEIHDTIKASLQEELASMFTNFSELDISNFPSDEPDPLVHENNLAALNWILNNIIKPSNDILTLQNRDQSDYFLNYKKHD